MFWKNDSDNFIFKFKFSNIPDDVLNKIRPPSKRELLSIIMSIFDPFGFLTNIHIYAKIQSLWKLPLSWDDLLPEDIAMKWYHWHSKLSEIENIRIPRCYFRKFSPNSSIELHVFFDASIEAYAAVSYWRLVNSNNVQVAFIYGKAKVAPKRMLSEKNLAGCTGNTHKRIHHQ